MNVDPLRASLLAAAKRDADAIVARATADAADLLERARADADAAVAQASRDADAAAAARSAGALAAARAEARARIVTAQGRVRASVLAAAAEAVQGIRVEARYDTLRAGLAARAQRELGEDAALDLDPPGGGVVARRDRRLLDLSLPSLLARAAEAHGGELAALCR